MTAQVNREACIRCGLCAGLCPAVFSLAPGEAAQAAEGELTGSAAMIGAKEAAENCPTAAIIIK